MTDRGVDMGGEGAVHKSVRALRSQEQKLDLVGNGFEIRVRGHDDGSAV